MTPRLYAIIPMRLRPDIALFLTLGIATIIYVVFLSISPTKTLTSLGTETKYIEIENSTSQKKEFDLIQLTQEDSHRHPNDEPFFYQNVNDVVDSSNPALSTGNQRRTSTNQLERVVKLGEELPVVAWLRERTDDFRFPSLVNTGTGLEMTIPAGDLPSRSARRYVLQGSGQLVGLGDTIELEYEIYSWNTGVLIGSSNEYAINLSVELGKNNILPPYVEQSLLGRTTGSQIQVIVESGEFVPEAIDVHDVYIYVLKIKSVI